MQSRVLVASLLLCSGCITKSPVTDDGNVLEPKTDSSANGESTEESNLDTDDDTLVDDGGSENTSTHTGSSSEETETSTLEATDSKDESSKSDSGDESNDEDSTTSDTTSEESTTDSTESESEASGESTTGEDLECGDLEITVRDFKEDHPDFEVYSGTMAYTGIVESTIGLDRKPVYAHMDSTQQTTGPSEFGQWYNDHSNNQKIEVTIRLEEVEPGLFVYDNSEFFPADGQGWGNEGRGHNFHFTTEMHTEFKYEGGEEFTFTGDDDLWLFINGKLAIDLGGLHPPLEATIFLDQMASELGIEIGNTYAFEIFHAERHTTGSNFRIQTTIDCFIPPPPG